jgi:hypothetical protein
MNRDEYAGEIPGDSDLKAINEMIALEEAGDSEFINSEIVSDPAGVKNRLTFRKILARPRPLTIIKQSDPQPPWINMVWSGVMVVEGTLTSVIAYREIAFPECDMCFEDDGGSRDHK